MAYCFPKPKSEKREAAARVEVRRLDQGAILLDGYFRKIATIASEVFYLILMVKVDPEWFFYPRSISGCDRLLDDNPDLEHRIWITKDRAIAHPEFAAEGAMEDIRYHSHQNARGGWSDIAYVRASRTYLEVEMQEKRRAPSKKKEEKPRPKKKATLVVRKRAKGQTQKPRPDDAGSLAAAGVGVRSREAPEKSETLIDPYAPRPLTAILEDYVIDETTLAILLDPNFTSESPEPQDIEFSQDSRLPDPTIEVRPTLSAKVTPHPIGVSSLAPPASSVREHQDDSTRISMPAPGLDDLDKDDFLELMDALDKDDFLALMDVDYPTALA